MVFVESSPSSSALCYGPCRVIAFLFSIMLWTLSSHRLPLQHYVMVLVESSPSSSALCYGLCRVIAFLFSIMLYGLREESQTSSLALCYMVFVESSASSSSLCYGLCRFIAFLFSIMLRFSSSHRLPLRHCCYGHRRLHPVL